MPAAVRSTTRLLPVLATNTSPAASTATPWGPDSPTRSTTDCTPVGVSFTTSLRVGLTDEHVARRVHRHPGGIGRVGADQRLLGPEAR